MTKPTLDRPLPHYDGPYQSGITDPVWPAEPPASGLDPDVYAAQYAGQLERQRHLHIVTADTTSRSPSELRDVLKAVTTLARHQMQKVPPKDVQREYDPPVVSRRVSVTVGLGATLFTTIQGDDRFGLAARRPSWLRVMPAMDGDEAAFDPRDHAADLIFLLSSDDLYVNEYIFGLLYYGRVIPRLVVRSVEHGYARPDNREPSGFEDGLSNPRDLPPNSPMKRFVYVRPGDPEPRWCINGTYLAYRKIRRRLARFFKLQVPDREAMFGVERTTGTRLPNPSPHAHAPKINPRRPDADLFGTMDDTRRFLRRPYFFDDGLDSDGEEIRGIHHLSFVRNLAAQYEWPVLMWQMNKDFPHPNAGRDPLYEVGGASNVGGGFYFFPRAAPAGDYLGSALL
jgi:deferrochelatase/peroxidase EfeB